MWLHCAPPLAALPGQGWKIHVSTAYDNRFEVLRRTVATAVNSGCAFKLVGSTRLLNMINSKWMSRTAAGKFVTLYPADDAAFTALVHDLADALDGFSGPFILTDTRFRPTAPVFYRFGAFTRDARIRPDGTKVLGLRDADGEWREDNRSIPYEPPADRTNPLGRPDTVAVGSRPTLAGKYAVDSVIRFSAAGGVYRATRIADGRKVVLKETRPHTGWYCGKDSTSRLHTEWAALRRLADVAGVPEPVDFFTQWEHSFLAAEWIPGIPLSGLLAREHPLLRARPVDDGVSAYRTLVRKLWRQLDEIVAACHARRVLVGDISVTNLLWDVAAERLHLVDLESVALGQGDDIGGPATNGFRRPARPLLSPLTEQDDLFAIAAVKCATLLPINNLLPLAPESFLAVIGRVAECLGMAAETADVLSTLRKALWPSQWTSPGSTRTFHAVPMPAHRSPAAVTPSHPASGEIPVERAVEGLYQLQLNTLTPHRDDRLFPGDHRAFVTNPLGMAWGAAGLLHAWAYCRLPIPPPAREWLIRHTSTADDLPPGLLTGKAGIAWTLLELGETVLADMLLTDAVEQGPRTGSYDFAEGIAGIGLACLKGWQLTADATFLDRANQCGDLIERAAQRAEHGARWASWRAKDYLGLAHGSSGIALFMLYLAAVRDSDRLLRLAKDAVDYDLHHCFIQDGVLGISDTAGGRRVLYPGWSIGSAGVLTSLMRVHHLSRDRRLAEYAERLASSAVPRLSVSPALFNGLAGFANCALDLNHFGFDLDLPNPTDIIASIAGYLFPLAGGIACPGDRLFRVSCDFATGSAGVMCVLHRAHSRAPDFNLTLDCLLFPRTETPAPLGLAKKEMSHVDTG